MNVCLGSEALEQNRVVLIIRVGEVEDGETVVWTVVSHVGGEHVVSESGSADDTEVLLSKSLAEVDGVGDVDATVGVDVWRSHEGEDGTVWAAERFQ